MFLSEVEILYDTHISFTQLGSAQLHVPLLPQSLGLLG